MLFQDHLVFVLPQHGINHFFKEPLFLLVKKMVFKGYDLDISVLIAFGVSLLPGSLSVTKTNEYK